MTAPVEIVGAPGSPYTRKMRALLRYRRVPHRFRMATGPTHPTLGPPPLPLLPAVYLPVADGYEATSDSTFQIRRLEEAYPERSAVPADPAVAFVDFLVEDYADEWVTKLMFHYRWAIPENAEWASRLLPRWNLAVPEELAKKFETTFAQRQIGRLGVVGSHPATAPLIEASYARLLGLLETHFQTHKFVLGDRPGTGDFALHGQLTQLVQVEPTSQALAREIAPRVVAWCEVVEDLSGLDVADGDWLAREALREALHPLLCEIGRTYAPFLLANARALDSGEDEVACEIDGKPYTQKPFKYQGKCLTWLREACAALAPGDRAAVDVALAGTGCDALFPD